jgi:hypothetical protein
MVNKKIVILCLALVFSASPLALAFSVKGYQWGRSLEDMRKDLEAREKKTVYSEKKQTLVFTDKVFGKECEVSLLFTPKTKLLAGVAVIWSDPEAAILAKDDLTKKYGSPLSPQSKAQGKKYFMWSSPTSRFDRITLVAGLNRTMMAYYGGEYYRQYMEESAQEGGKPGPMVMSADAKDEKK